MAENTPTPGHYVANAGLFLDFIVSKLFWRNLDDEIIFDVGCGNPKIKLADLLVNRFPGLQKVVAIDSKTYLIRYIRCKKPHPQIEHCVGDIENKSDLVKFESKVDKVISTHCFHMVQKQESAFQNVFYILKPGGQAAFLFCLSSGYADWFTDLIQNLKWNKYYKGNGPIIPVTQFMNLSDEYYVKVMEDAGFVVTYCEKEKICSPYQSDEECKDALNKICSFSFDVPGEITDEFHEDLFETFMKYNGRDSEDKPCQISYYLTAFVVKPLE